MTVEEAILSHDMEDVVDRMILYAREKFKSLDVKSLQGKEPFDFVQDVLCKSLESKRNWDESKCSFVEFLFGCLRSEISNFFSSNQIFHQDIPDDLSADNESVNEEILEVTKILKQEGADDDEIIIFTYWTDGISKPAAISEDLGIEVKEVLNITKRLRRRLIKVQSKVRQLI
ncbi:hypothetical protein [uncultured Bacteroides sp.]|uniref:hypothetical protein n=1 Tax=uncultured Bacteroides sp. TaxID=162156 RepID=UPI002AA72AEF|nr:hypothetical protein [uncultured Bacteroides sp.]